MKKTMRMNGWLLLLVAAGAVAAAGGCEAVLGDSSHPTIETGGAGGTGSTSHSSSHASSSSSGTTSGTGGASSSTSSGTTSTSTSSSGTGGGSTTDACTAYLLEECKQLKACAPHVYAQLYESDDALCQSEATRLCGDLPTGLDHTSVGFNDPAMCTTLISGSCNAFLDALGLGAGPQYPAIPEACQPKPGTLALDQGCAASSQCGPNLSCFSGGQPSCMQYCGPVGTAGRPCGSVDDENGTPQDFFCDPNDNLHCVTGTTGTGADTSLVCRVVIYGEAGAMCTPGSDKQCDYGFTCSLTGATKGTCIAQLQEAATCDKTTTDKDPCDTRLGIQCLPNKAPATGSSCQVPTTYVPVGAACSGTTNQTCSDYAFCNSSSQCERLATVNQGCVTGGCFPPYVCTAGTCQPPPVTVDPACTPEPIADNACGHTPGGLPIVCDNAPCCGEGAAVGGGSLTCGTGPTTCAAGMNQTQLYCEDSSQCAQGSLCCLSFNPNGIPFIKASCKTSAQCGGFEVCRTESAAPCAGSGGVCTGITTITTHDWSTALGITDIGFCAVPSCAALQDPCSANSDCCSGSCEPGYQQCN